MSNHIQVFDFQNHRVRAVASDPLRPLFVAKDIAKALGFKQHKQAIKQHCRGVVKHVPLLTNGGNQKFRVIEEPDLYRLIFGSNSESAKRFQDWIFEEVLPSIRKTGSYTSSFSVETITNKQYYMLRHEVMFIASSFQRRSSAEFAAWRALRRFAGVTSSKDIPFEKFDKCLNFLKDIKEKVEPYNEAVREIETKIFRRTFNLDLLDLKLIEQGLVECTTIH